MTDPATPKTINLKRKADEAPPTTLILEKRINSGAWIYRRKEVEGIAIEPTLTEAKGQDTTSPIRSIATPARKQVERRIFHLNRPEGNDPKKRKTRHDAILTVSETNTQQNDIRQELKEEMDIDALNLKRPGRNAAVNTQRINSTKPTPAPTPRQQAATEAIADELHEFALEELARQSKPKTAPVPKISGARSKALHQQRASQVQNSMTIGEEYVFDTYELVPAGDLQSARFGPDRDFENVGYLVISEEDEELWERLQEEEASDKDWDTDEEDENAEAYYGADYPEDELASDDEYDRDMYKVGRKDGSDDEEWDQDTGSYSDDEYERTMNPWKAKTPAQFSQYLHG